MHLGEDIGCGSAPNGIVDGNVLDVCLQLLGMCPAVYENILHARMCKELERIFDQRSIGQRQKALRQVSQPDSACAFMRTRPDSP